VRWDQRSGDGDLANGKSLSVEVIAAAGAAAMWTARTMDNTDHDVRKVAPVFVARAQAACRR
jgi:hypothetical protein